MTVINKSQFFGLTNFGIVQGTKFACEVNTCPDGIFKGYSILLSTFDPKLDWKEAFQKNQLIRAARATLHPRLTKPQRTWLHNRLVTYLDDPESQAMGFPLTLVVNLEAMKKEGHVIEYTLHPLIQQAIDDVSQEDRTSNAA
jgi:hypothetical protein